MLKSGVSVVAYAPSLAQCQTTRAKDLATINRSDWDGISECGRVVVNAGTGWSAFSIVDVPGLGIAVSDETACALFQQQYTAQTPLVNRPVGTGSWMHVPAYRVTKCSPVAVTASDLPLVATSDLPPAPPKPWRILAVRVWLASGRKADTFSETTYTNPADCQTALNTQIDNITRGNPLTTSRVKDTIKWRTFEPDQDVSYQCVQR